MHNDMGKGSDPNAELRQKAESVLRGVSVDVTTLSTKEMQQLMHELQVHQIELEMQNETLRLAQTQLSQSREQYVDLYDSSPVGYLTITKKGLIKQANLTSASVLRVDRTPLLNKPFSRYVTRASQDRYFLHHRQVLKTKSMQTCELKLVTSDGTEFDARLDSIPDEDGHFRTTLHDITEQKQAEKALSASEQKYRHLVEALQEGIWVIDKDARTTFVNQSMADMLGYTIDEMQGRHLFSFMDKKKVAAAQQNLDRRQQGIIEQHDFEFLRKDGSPIFVVLATAPITDENGNFNGAVAGLIDITEQVQSKIALQESHELLENTLAELNSTQAQLVRQERQAAVGQLAAGIAHDFNNIVAGILLHAQLMLTNSDLKPEDRHKIEMIYQQGEQAATLTHQILDFSRKSMMRREYIDLCLFLEDLHRLFIHTLPENILLSMNYHVKTCPVNGDTARLQQAVLNMVINARDAMPDGGKLDIVLEQVVVREDGERPYHRLTPGKWARISVTDNGIGIPEPILDQIFEPFFTTKAPMGSGLGLSQVFGIVRQHEGYADVSTTVGEGSTFFLYLPMLPASQPVLPSQQPDILSLGHEETVLIVEDNKIVRQSLIEAVETLNYRSLGAKNGREALTLCHSPKNNISLVITDLIMPEVGGKELLNILNKTMPDIKVIVITGHPLANRGTDLLSAGADGWLQKPVNLYQLSQEVARVLEMKRP
ncbi:MAG: PAS domain S-box protein [Chloroflexi bacterium]|nr:MAG: PAS domain S-box protein [Chloroflexota bacterium]